MENTKIQWATHTFNPWEGCTKVSPGCANCYAEARNHRFGADNWGKGKPRRRTSKANWSKPHRWNNEDPYTAQYRARVFCASLADWLDDEVPIAWLADLLKLIHDTPNLDWLLLTKRPENWRSRVEAAGDSHFDHGDRNVTGWLQDWWKCGFAPPNVWIGTSVEDQIRANQRRESFGLIPARVHFVSYEPALGPVDWRGWEFADQIICGGESGKNSRPCDIRWFRDTRDWCRKNGVKVFVKQLGSLPFCDGNPIFTRHTFGPVVQKTHRPKIDKKGGDMDEWPEDLRVREFPVPPSPPAPLASRNP